MRAWSTRCLKSFGNLIAAVISHTLKSCPAQSPKMTRWTKREKTSGIAIELLLEANRELADKPIEGENITREQITVSVA